MLAALAGDGRDGRDGRDEGAGGGGRESACTPLLGRGSEVGVGGDENDGDEDVGGVGGLTTVVLSPELSRELAKRSSYPRLIKIGRAPLVAMSSLASGLDVAVARSR